MPDAPKGNSGYVSPTPGEVRIEHQIEGLRSVMAGGLLALGEANRALASELESNTNGNRNLTTAVDMLRDVCAELVLEVRNLASKLSTI